MVDPECDYIPFSFNLLIKKTIFIISVTIITAEMTWGEHKQGRTHGQHSHLGPKRPNK